MEKALFGAPLPVEAFEGKFNEQHLIITTTLSLGIDAMEARLVLDKSPHVALFGALLHAGPQEEFPYFKQMYLLVWGDMVNNPWLHTGITTMFLQRVREHSHVWLFIPESLEVMARVWGPDLMKLSAFPQLTIHGLIEQDVNWDYMGRVENIHEQDGSNLPDWFWRPPSESR
jgi:hypothetical protein